MQQGLGVVEIDHPVVIEIGGGIVVGTTPPRHVRRGERLDVRQVDLAVTIDVAHQRRLGGVGAGGLVEPGHGRGQQPRLRACGKGHGVGVYPGPERSAVLEGKRLSLIACRGLDARIEWTVRRRLHEQPEDHAVFPRRDVLRFDNRARGADRMRARDVAQARADHVRGRRAAEREARFQNIKARAQMKRPTVRHRRPSVAALSDRNQRTHVYRFGSLLKKLNGL